MLVLKLMMRPRARLGSPEAEARPLFKPANRRPVYA